MKALPQKLVGKGKLIQTINDLIECIAERTIIDSPDIKTEKRPGGTSLKTAKASGTGGEPNTWG